MSRKLASCYCACAAEMSFDDEDILPINMNFGANLDEDDVFLTFLKEPNEDAKYRSKLSSLYSNEALQTVQQGIIALFQKKQSTETPVSLNRTVRSLLKQDIGDFIVPYYEERILKKGMFILKEDIKQDEGENLLIGLTEIWNYFYTHLLPAVQIILYGVKPYKKLSVRDRTLLAFRDELLLKTEIRGSILLVARSKKQKKRGCAEYTIDERIISAVEQMFLVLLQASPQANKPYYEIETLTAQVISPLMTPRGVYYDGKVPPPLPASQKELKKAKSSGSLRLHEESDRTFTLPRKMGSKHSRQRSTPVTFLKEMFNVGSSYISDSSRGRTQSHSDL